MGKNKARHLLHGILDLLPLFVIPIFVIYTRNENYNSNIEVQVQENKVVDFNQFIRNGNFENTNNWTGSSKTTLNVNDNIGTITLTPSTTSDNLFIYQNFGILGNTEHIYYLKYEYSFISNIRATAVNYNDGITYTNLPSVNEPTGYYQQRFTPNCEFVRFQFTFYGSGNISNDAYATLSNIQCFDLTQMFGSGNEPTISEFENIFTENFYEYTLSQNRLVPNYTTTYNDTDVGSQFVYTLYNTVDKYFNMGNVFNMNDVYDWFVLNIFGGNASMSIYIVWNIVLYEFVMDLLFLLYALFMFFIDMCKRLMEKPLNSIK